MKRLIYQLFGIVVGVQLLALVAVPKDVNANDSFVTYDQLKAYQEQQAEIEWSNQLVSYASTLVGKRTGQCVTSLRTYFGIPRNEVQGLAKNTKINSPTGKVGAIVVFKKLSWAGHVGYQITPVRPDGNFEYFDSNGGWSLRGAIRTINVKDPKISGYRLVNYQK